MFQARGHIKEKGDRVAIRGESSRKAENAMGVARFLEMEVSIGRTIDATNFMRSNFEVINRVSREPLWL